jgi:uncharacterized protein (TIGR03437 family)
VLVFLAILLLSAPLLAQSGTGTWLPRAPYPITLTEISGAAVGTNLHMMCGITPTGSTRDHFVYDTLRDLWTAAAPIPTIGGADHCNVASVAGKVYLLGGIRIGTAAVDGDTYEYDPATNSWQRLATMPTPRGASGVAVIGTRIYVAGGLASSGVVRSFEAFDTATRQWAVLPAMPTARDHLTAQSLNGKFYALSGRNGGTMLPQTEEFDPATNTWRTRAPIPVPRGGLASGIAGGRIIVFGGEGPSGTPERTFKQTHAYDPSTDQWTSLADMPTPRHGFYGVSVGNRIFVPGGGPREGGSFSNIHEVFYPTPERPPSITQIVNAASYRPDIAPGSLITVQGSSLSFGEQIATAVPLPMELNAVKLFTGAAQPLAQLGLLFVSAGQINALLGSSASAGMLTFAVNHLGLPSENRNANVLASAPGIFAADGSGRGQGAILNAGTATLADAATPARRGAFIEIYATGLGRMLPTVTLGGAQAEVTFAGPAPGFEGLDQINARIPAGVTPGNAVPIVLRTGNFTSNEVTIAIAP